MSDFRVAAAKYLRKERGYKYVMLLGKGSYGTVIQMQNKEKEMLAIKLVNKKLTNTLEIGQWIDLNHGNILKLLFVDQTLPTCVIFATELMSCNLTKHLQGKEFRESKDAINRSKRCMKEILLGLDYLHNRHMCHLDLRADNIFIAFDGRAVIADFSGLCHSNEKKNFCPLPRCFRPPEMLKSKKKVWPRPIDLWSCGLLAVHLFFLKKFYKMTLLQGTVGTLEATKLYVEAFRNASKVEAIVRKNFPSCSMPNNFVTDFISFISQFLHNKPRKRCHANEALYHGFLALGCSEEGSSNIDPMSLPSCSSSAKGGASLFTMKATLEVSTSTECSSDSSTKVHKRLLSAQTIPDARTTSESSSTLRFCKSSRSFRPVKHSSQRPDSRSDRACALGSDLIGRSVRDGFLSEGHSAEPKSVFHISSKEPMIGTDKPEKSQSSSTKGESREFLVPSHTTTGDSSESSSSEPTDPPITRSNWKRIKDRLRVFGKLLKGKRR